MVHFSDIVLLWSLLEEDGGSDDAPIQILFNNAAKIAG